ncbi:hypothetical protein [Sphingomonas sp. IC4-52]|uniref:hypothetical protein n=1 Tax=Sphingomonas sp. IC4-52 TaxID=2887202 RepID=UPI001D122977|nr:hypothetical protein [Sphingomonas sp. IC4-52]MCC2981684.1 hypothetical protein [Sphingomonas sp. IC4-52]
MKVFEAGTLIAEADVFAVDPPMGVVMAKLFATDAYHQSRHASVIDAEFVGDRGDIIQLETQDGVAIRSEGVSILDFPTLDDREIHILGIYEPSVDEIIKDHPNLTDL